ncbi:MAG: BatA domain-containing protein [Cytophagales bacterium]|nr:BatA domain-containing protein [Cytophaga sp.]
MNFLNPYFLFGLFSIAIPVVLHLFDLQRPKKIIFTNVAFLREIIQQQSSARRLKHWLILLSRILFLLFLVLAFAQPLYKNKTGFHPVESSGVQVYIDNSYSMQNEQDQQSLLEHADGLAQNVQNTYNPSTTYRLFTNQFSGDDWQYRTKEGYSDQLTELDYIGQSRSYTEVSQRITSGFNENNATQDVYIFSDFQKTYWKDMIQAVPDSQFNLHIIPVTADESLNMCIDSIWLQNPFIQVGKANKLMIKVKAYGTGKRETICKLFIDDVQISTIGVDITGGQELNTAFDFTLDKNGTYKGMIRFDDSPVTFDNTFYFTLSSVNEVNISNLYHNDGKYVTKIYSNEGLFNLNSFTYNNIDYSKLRQSDLIVIEEYANASEALTQNLKQFLNSGGNIALFSPKTDDWTQWQQLLKCLNVSVKPTTLKDSTGKRSWYLQFPDTDQPFFRDVFADKKKSFSEMPFSIPLFETTTPGTILLRYQQGTPFLTQIPSGKGSLYVFNGCLNDAFSSFQRHSIFVPVMYNIAFASLRTSDNLYNRTTDQTITVKADGIKQVHLIKDTLNWLPVQNAVDQTIILDLPDEIKTAGFYDIKNADSLVSYIAVNYGRGESDITSISGEELKDWAVGKKNVHLLDAVNQGDFVNELKSLRDGKPLWKYCIMFALFFLLGEILLLRFLK